MDVFMSSLTHHLFILMEYGGCRVIMLITFYVAKGERSHISLRQYRIPIVRVIFDTSIMLLSQVLYVQ